MKIAEVTTYFHSSFLGFLMLFEKSGKISRKQKKKGTSKHKLVENEHDGKM